MMPYFRFCALGEKKKKGKKTQHKDVMMTKGASKLPIAETNRSALKIKQRNSVTSDRVTLF